MLQEERASSEEEASSPAPSRPVSRARKLRRLNSITDILNHNASGDEEGGLLSGVDAGCEGEEEEEEEEDMDAVASGGEGEKDEGDGEQVSSCGKKKKSVMEDQEVSDSAICN
jgi:hypothetical protein